MLARLRKARRSDEGGFTLIELLVVIIIIGILAAIAIPTFLNQRKKGFVTAIKSDISSAQIAEETYATDNNGAYTATLTFNQTPNVTVTPALITGGYTLTGSNSALSGCSIVFNSTTGVSTSSSGC